jgi:hypothetical protein
MVQILIGGSETGWTDWKKRVVVIIFFTDFTLRNEFTVNSFLTEVALSTLTPVHEGPC